MMSNIAARTIVIVFILGLSSCGEMLQFYEKVTGKKIDVNDDEYIPVPGSPASEHLSKTLSNSTENTSAALSGLDLAIKDQATTNLIEMGLMLADNEKAVQADSGTFEEVFSGEKKKRSLDVDSFQKHESTQFKVKTNLVATDYSQNTVNWGSSTDTSFTISMLDRMPVRSQGKRGTCSSFAAVALLEAIILKNNSTSIPYKEIDLSEQRFYFLSKPESWSDGGSVAKQGADSGSGFLSSSGELSGYSSPTDTSGSKFNIPLESQCKYVPIVGANDLQVPLADSCRNSGIVRVSKFSSWAGAVGGTTTIDTAQQIYDELRRDKPVIVYTKLSKNWEKNDGMVTFKGAGSPGDSSHASGHAYLIVGAKKIDEAAFPGEGGLCFVVRNSWGTGWGVKGLSCITLKWFNQWRYEGPFPTVEEVQLTDQSKNLITIAAQRPSNLPEPDPSTKKNRKGGSSAKRKGKVVLKIMPDGAQTIASPWLPQSFGVSALQEIDSALLTADDFKFGRLVTDDDQTYKVLYLADDTNLVLRGILDGDKSQTHNLELKRNGNFISTTIDGRGDVIVGEMTAANEATDGVSSILTICGRKYGSICDLNYVAESNEFVIGLSEIEAKRQISKPPYSWNTVGIAGYGFEMSRPESTASKFDLRLVNGGKPTNPVRLKVDPSSGSLNHKGQEVGNLSKGSLCSGDYRSRCRVLQSGESFDILPKSVD
ncbi:MAG: C1 family peptidase [Proteobacteria bacterium]|nr:C1 family peptidase [Pseudomonadota bacterium]